MKKVLEAVQRVRTFGDEVKAELKKCTWPGRSELFESTMVVVVSVALLSLFVGLCDKVLLTLLRLLTGMVR